jgi:2-dehydropantoate 2-reductase
MVPSNPKIAWIGMGALGLLYAGALARDGVDMHLLFRSDYEAARTQGISVRSIRGDFHVPPAAFHAYRHSGDMPRCDLVIISTKTTSNADLPDLIRPLVGPDTLILTLQNGMGNEEFLASHFGPDRILGGTAFVSVHRIAPATADHQSSGRLAIGKLNAPPDDATRGVVRLLERTGFKIDLLESLKLGRWEKQLWNVPFNGLGAALLADTAVLLQTTWGTNLVRTIMQEVLAVARADGAALGRDMIDSKISYTLKMGAYRTSMQLDREAGRPLELASIIDPVLHKSLKLGVSTPNLNILQSQLHTVDMARNRSH